MRSCQLFSMIQLMTFGIVFLQFATALAEIDHGQADSMVKITKTIFRIRLVDAITNISWHERAPSTVYCVSEPRAIILFDCPDCNPQIPAEKKFMQQLKNATTVDEARYPVIAIGGQFAKIDVSRSMSGKHLRCNATIARNETNQPSEDEVSVISVSALIDVKYTDKPVLVDENGHEFADGIYVPVSDEMVTVKCKVSGNPMPRTASLKVGNENVNSFNYSIGRQHKDNVVRCSVLDDLGKLRWSRPLVVKLYDAPVITSTKYVSKNYSMQQKATLECTVKAKPKPRVLWRMIGISSDSQAVCDEHGNATGLEKVEADTLDQDINSVSSISVTSTCIITLNSTSKVGKYYCVGCLELMKHAPICSPGAKPAKTAYIGISDETVRATLTSVVSPYLGQSSATQKNDIGNPKVGYFVAVSILAILILIGAVVVAVILFRRFNVSTLESRVCNADQKNLNFQKARQDKPSEILRQETRSQSAGQPSIFEEIGRSLSYGLTILPGRN